MECSVKTRFLAQKRLKPTYQDYNLRRRKLSGWLQLVSAVASVAFMAILTLAVTVAYLSTPKREELKASKLRVSAPQETARITR
jgi:hypothetical protein